MPYNLRAKGMALYVSVQNLANAFNQFVNPVSHISTILPI
jgi:hypothetical protein